MQTWIALFRGINVGGHNILPMAQLRSELASLKLSNVRSYIQSGNVVFDSTTRSATSLQRKIASLIAERHGFQVQLLLLRHDDLLAAVEANPFPEAASEPKTLHLFFLERIPDAPDTEALERLRAPTERCSMTDAVFYLHTPDGLGRSRLAAKVEKHLGVVATARNFRTVEKLLAMAAAET